MDANTRRQIKALEKLRLPELQARFAEVIGETTRSPNKTFLIRRITDALTAQAEPSRPDETVTTAAATTAAPASTVPTTAAQAADRATPGQAVPSTPARPGRPTRRGASSSAPGETRASSPTQAASDAEPRLSKLPIEALRAKFAEVVGRPTGSSHKAYLLWKIRQAQNGHIRVGPARQRSSANPADMKVLPLRLESNAVEHLDAARQRLGLASRTDLFRRALELFLKKNGEPEVAALFSAPAQA